MVKALFDADVPILVGTDTPNPLLVPGFAIHEELECLFRTGLPIDAILRAATCEAAAHLGWEKQGAIAPGQVADLILLEGNPLESLACLRRPIGVFVAGEYFSRADLSAMLESLKRSD